LDSALPSLSGINGIELASMDWLSLHHRVKQKERKEFLRSLDIREGDRVLDLGCGPGFWVDLLADIVGKSGAIVGIDIDEPILNYARETVQARRVGFDIEFRNMSFESIDATIGEFDVVFFANCICYVDDPGNFLRGATERARAGGRVIGRNWDGAVFILNPIPERILARMQLALLEVFDVHQPKGKYFDHYFGRKLPGLFTRQGFREISVKTDVFERYGPADEDLTRYIENVGSWMETSVSEVWSQEDRSEWLRYFDPDDEKYICKEDDFYFCMTETAVTGYV